MYDMPPDQPEKIRAYTDKLRGWMIETVVAAVKDQKPAKLSIGKGTARFAVNRRKATDKGVINDRNPEGPVDHSVPVLKVEDDKRAESRCLRLRLPKYDDAVLRVVRRLRGLRANRDRK